jgi:RimJ/RimL family protein N-acetyltransferase
VHGFAVVLPAERISIMIGSCGYKGPPNGGWVEIAYGIAPDYRGKGYATEIAETLTAHAFDHQEVNTVRAHTLPECNASGRILTKCGFKLVGEVRDPEDGLIWRWEKPRQTSIP